MMFEVSEESNYTQLYNLKAAAAFWLKDYCMTSFIANYLLDNFDLGESKEGIVKLQEAAEFDLVVQSDGIIDPKLILPYARILFREMSQLLKFCFSLPSNIFSEIVKIPPKNLALRAFNDKYQYRISFGKDDYNFDHLLRTELMRTRGIPAVGINHGLPVPEIINPVWRYIDFDVYFVFGRAIRSHYQRTWGSKMEVSAVGAIAVTPDQFKLAQSERDHDFVVFYTPIPEFREWLEEIVKLAKSFPNHRFYLKHKRSQPGRIRSVIEALGDSLPENIIETGDKATDLILNCRYAVVTRNSTVAAEAIQLKSLAYVLDVSPVDMVSYYRLFDGLVFAGAKALAADIHDIAAGRKSYARENYRDLIATPRQPIAELVKHALAQVSADAIRVAAE